MTESNLALICIVGWILNLVLMAFVLAFGVYVLKKKFRPKEILWFRTIAVLVIPYGLILVFLYFFLEDL